MNAEEREVAKPLVEHPNFRWMAGMVLDYYGSDQICASEGSHDHWPEPMFAEAGYLTDEAGKQVYQTEGTGTLDISDAATKGCLLALARELWGVRGQTVEWCDGSGSPEDPEIWGWRKSSAFLVALTEGIALARAIMEAPVR